MSMGKVLTQEQKLFIYRHRNRPKPTPYAELSRIFEKTYGVPISNATLCNLVNSGKLVTTPQKPPTAKEIDLQIINAFHKKNAGKAKMNQRHIEAAIDELIWFTIASPSAMMATRLNKIFNEMIRRKVIEKLPVSGSVWKVNPI